MRERRFLIAALVLGAAIAIAGGACSRTDRIAEARANHAVELLGFSVERAVQTPPAAEVPGRGERAPTEATSTEPSPEPQSESEARLFVADAERAAVRLRVKVKRADVNKALPGITLEAVLQDGETGAEKEAYRVWLPLGGQWPGGEQIAEAEVAGVPYREGDTFDVTLRAQVPKVEQSLYREFAGR